MATKVTRKVGDIHPNGKWMWTEYRPGKFDWRGIKAQDSTTEETKVEETEVKTEETAATPEPQVEEKKELDFKTRKDFINNTEYELTKEEAEWWRKSKFAKDSNLTVRNTWQTLMGRIGSCSLSIVKYKPDGSCGKDKNFNTHPDWRPLAFTTIHFRGWRGDYHSVEVIAQSWDEIRKKSDDTESHSWTIYKHPHQ